MPSVICAECHLCRVSFVLSAVFSDCHYAGCNCADCRLWRMKFIMSVVHADCNLCRVLFILSVVMLSSEIKTLNFTRNS